MKQYALYIFVLVTTLAFVSCSVPIQNDPAKFVDVADEVELHILPDLEDRSSFFLAISTIKSNYCAESQFITSFSENKELATLDIDALEIPSDCSNFDSKISTFSEFSIEDASKTVDITLAKSIENKFYLDKSESRITILTNNLRGIVFEEDHLILMRNNFLFGGIFSESTEEKEKFGQLISSIQTIYDSQDIAYGNYGHFIKGETTSFINPINLDMTREGFAFEVLSEGKLIDTDIPQLILDFKMENPEIDFYITSGEGVNF